MIVTAATGSELDWIEQRTGCVLTRNARAIKAVDGDGRTKGMVAYDCWTENSCQAHMAVDAPIVWRSLVRPAFQYAFVQAGKEILVAIIQESNARSVNLVRRFGFWCTYRLKDGWAKGEDLLFYEMKRDECRWLDDNRKVA